MSSSILRQQSTNCFIFNNQQQQQVTGYYLRKFMKDNRHGWSTSLSTICNDRIGAIRASVVETTPLPSSISFPLLQPPPQPEDITASV
ncbi:unnamed protein product, partial [Ilex paraguariensis]